MHILSFLGASDLYQASLASKSVRQACMSPILWKQLCIHTGKFQEERKYQDRSLFEFKGNKNDPEYFLRLYYHSRCVPTDFSTIREAIQTAPAGCVITLQPGVYEGEQIYINGKALQIQAAHPEKGACIVFYTQCDNHSDDGEYTIPHCPNCDDHDLEDNPAINIHHSAICLQDLSILHYAEGTGHRECNTAILCSNRSNLIVNRCSIQSDSGSGIVLSKHSVLTASDAVIHDCAAAGVFSRDNGACIDLDACMILRNGFGTRVSPLGPNATETITGGHSGIDVEGANVYNSSTLIAESSCIGLSVWRNEKRVELNYNTWLGNEPGPFAILATKEAATLENGTEEHGKFVLGDNNILAPGPLKPDEEIERHIMRHPWIRFRPYSKQSLREPLK
mmetsp:Transcript_82813/g.239576  ORF Transcript_82813/g.239576 Transcript_82813/m.239576 type:complete len:393 (-) Transcript_82813:82-1260(-)|eukprot:CAMPEP_0176003654 /NCGR_PEP_ID=MMETSP0120_2-20121206/1287_1 /TAXON_ID=160619 /ORGANISM="Kryptoperidinium foliaceum, Strain CCMP 1326" /LENGTH=392 /DNA_ID=CAMNT_0017336307 /DNA_START=115 /DNA_END=1293 /DNA_ORIENTATION=+